MVTWEKLGTTSSEIPTGSYYVAGDWTGYQLEEMKADSSAPNTFKLEVKLTYGGGIFQIVRDRDWSQIFYPNPDMGAAAADKVLGPDDLIYGYGWNLDGKPGDKFSIQFTRSPEDGKDVKSVSFQITGHEPVSFAERMLGQ